MLRRSLILAALLSFGFASSANAECYRLSSDGAFEIPSSSAPSDTFRFALSARASRTTAGVKVSSRSYVQVVENDSAGNVTAAGQFSLSRFSFGGGSRKRATLSGHGQVQKDDGTIQGAEITVLLKNPITTKSGRITGEATVYIIFDDRKVFFGGGAELDAPFFVRLKKSSLACSL